MLIELCFRYVLSPTHLHEFKSADRISSQQPIMSLYLPDQKLGSHSSVNSSSHKFMLKGRQTGSMHRGHAWVFRAESFDTMMAWYEDLKNLTEKTGEERNAFVRRHARSVSGGSNKAGSISSDGVMDEDEADSVPYSATTPQVQPSLPNKDIPERPQPGGRFPSDLQVNRFLQAPLSSSSATSSGDHDTMIVADSQQEPSALVVHTHVDPQKSESRTQAQSNEQGSYSNQPARGQQLYGRLGIDSEWTDNPIQSKGYTTDSTYLQQPENPARLPPTDSVRERSNYADWMAPSSVGPRAMGAEAVEGEAHRQLNRQREQQNQHESSDATVAPSTGLGTGTSTNESVLVGEPDSINPSRTDYNIPATQFTEAYTDSITPSKSAETNDYCPTKDDSVGQGAISSNKGIPASGAGAIGKLSRQAQENLQDVSVRQSNDCVRTINDLHIPGEYPSASNI